MENDSVNVLSSRVEEVGFNEASMETNGNGMGAGDQQDRIKMKAKRLSTGIPESLRPAAGVAESTILELTNGTGNGNVRQVKNSRKPRNGFGRGLPKKGGAGGKGTWGRPGSELFVEDDENDTHDPNYDSDGQDYEIRVVKPDLTEEEIKKALEPIILEYFEHNSTSEVTMTLAETRLGPYKPYFVVQSITMAMDRKASHREQTSVLLADLHSRFLTSTAVAEGFDILLRNLPDLILDVPEAPTMLGSFIARAIADDCLPPMYLQSYKGQVECEHARTALSRADVLLNMKHGLVRLDNVWRAEGATRPVKSLIKRMVLLLKEYLSSGDIKEASRCLTELEVPHFHHELVYRAVVMVIEEINDRTADLMARLLKSLYASILITPDQMKRGFERVFDAMPDICIDVPPAYTVLDRFVTKCQQSGFLPDEVVKNIPIRGRKRFVSEGDGGRVKPEIV